MKNRVIKKKIDRMSEHGQEIGQSIVDRDSAGLGHIIIPNDIDRDQYIRRVSDTGRCLIVTTFDDPIRDVIVPKHLIQEIVFPILPSGRGSLITWINIPTVNQVILHGIVLQEDDTNNTREGEYQKAYSYKDYVVSDTVFSRKNTRLIVVKDEQGNEGGITLQASGRDFLSRIRLLANGTININSDDYIVSQVENSFTINIGSKEGEISTLVIDREKGVSYIDKDENVFLVNESGFSISNKNESLIKLLNDLLKLYINTKTIDGKPLNPSSIRSAVELITRFNNLFN